jgi:hypothetical protein
LPVPALTLNQHGGGELGHFLGEVDDLPHRLARPEDELRFSLFLDLGVQGDQLAAQILSLERVPDQ